jgi:hypothetical protein
MVREIHAPAPARIRWARPAAAPMVSGRSGATKRTTARFSRIESKTVKAIPRRRSDSGSLHAAHPLMRSPGKHDRKDVDARLVAELLADRPDW